MKNNFTIKYILLVIVQILICNYFHLSAYIMLSILPVLILCVPTRISTTETLFIAFATGLAVDFLADGLIGLNALALVPVAFFRKSIYRLYFGEDLIIRERDFTIHKYGIWKVGAAIMTAQALFLIVYLWGDGAAARPFLFNFERFLCSLAVATILSTVIAEFVQPDERR